MLIQSPILKKLYPTIEKIAEKIKQAVNDKQPILIRHHNDADGYCGAMALEYAIDPLLYERHSRERDTQYFYTRIQSKTPYYDYSDSIRDISMFMKAHERFGHKMPLIIIIDTGSSEQDLDSIKQIKLYGAEIIVIDHHPLCAEIEKEVNILLNPYMIKSTYDYCAGMLCVEIAELLCSDQKINILIAALSGIADKVRSEELKLYKKLLPKEYTDDYLIFLSECINYQAYYLPNESSIMLYDLILPSKERHNPLVALIGKKIKKAKRYALSTASKYAKKEDKGKFILAKLDLDNTNGTLEFPSTSKKISLLHDKLLSSEKKPVLTIGIRNGGITFRCSTKLSFD